MSVLQFCENQVNRLLSEQDFGSTFQHFVRELKLPEYPGLHVFPGAGKDGVIDLCQTLECSRVVFECKHIAEGGFKEAQKRWRNVAKKLQKHLANPSGPTKGQSQYEPWYHTDPVINRFFFCISCELSNQQQFDKLDAEILDFFHHLAKEHEHLNHLAQIIVKTLDWSDFYTRLEQSPRLMFRWFPRTCPEGLVPLDEFPDDGTFRSFLASTKLPYYSFTEHLKTHLAPQEVKALDEETLLRRLDANTGLVITGLGGMGKTRLMLELGQIAKKKGWLVFRVLSSLTLEAFEKFANVYNTDSDILLLFDYLELQKEFSIIIERLHELNDTYDLNIRYIATCRTSYYPVILSLSRQTQVSLPPGHTEQAKSWFGEYCKQRVVHILKQSDLSPTHERISICHDTPILAVFLSYLHNRNFNLDLNELLQEQNFGTWIAKRINLSFAPIVKQSVHRNISLLIGLFPMPSSSINTATKANHGEILDTLATDGWIEQLPVDESKGIDTWVTIHDVVADQIITSYLSNIPVTIGRFVTEFLSLATDMECLRSALYSLQRLQSDLMSVDWLTIINQAITVNPKIWRGVRDVLLQTPLLSPSQVVDLFSDNNEIWDEAEREVDIQNALALLVRKIVTNPDLILDYTRLSTIVSWMKEALRHARDKIFILRWGIRLDIDSFREETLSHIVANSTRLRIQYLLCAWLDAKGDIEPVREHLEAWLKEHATDLQAEFVYKAWLDAKGDIELVREHLEAWLKEHAIDLQADFVYKAWLDAKGDIELVREHLEAWLKEHATAPQAEFVYTAWLDAKGDIELVRNHLKAWLKEHATVPDADFICKTWLDAGGEFATIRNCAINWLHENTDKEEAVYLAKFITKEKTIPIETVRDILIWCRNFPNNEDTLWRITRLSNHLLRNEISEDLVVTSEVILKPRISGVYTMVSLYEAQNQVQTLFSFLIGAPKLAVGDFRIRIDTLFLEWLRNPMSFGTTPKPHINVQRASYFKRVFDLIISGNLDISVDREPLERFLNWVALWQPNNKSQLKKMLHLLKKDFPAHGLWNIPDYT